VAFGGACGGAGLGVRPASCSGAGCRESAEVATIERGIERNLADPSPLSRRFLGDGATHAPRPWRTSPPFEGLELPAGAPMHHPIFPVLRTRT